MSLESGFNEDFLDMLRALVERGVEFLVVGAHAMAVHGVPRATGDLDLFVRPAPENAKRILMALGDFEKPGTVYQIGLPPRRIDLMTAISGLEFDAAWPS